MCARQGAGASRPFADRPRGLHDTTAILAVLVLQHATRDRRNPAALGTDIPNLPDAVNREAYSHEVSSARPILAPIRMPIRHRKGSPTLPSSHPDHALTRP